jgi:predicted transcriptional regulator
MAFPSTSFRLDPALLARVDRYAEKVRRATGLRVSRHQAMAKLLTDALDAAQKDSGSGRPQRPSSRAPRR